MVYHRYINTDNEDNDGGAVAGPMVLASVNMKTFRELISVFCMFTVA